MKPVSRRNFFESTRTTGESVLRNSAVFCRISTVNPASASKRSRTVCIEYTCPVPLRKASG